MQKRKFRIGEFAKTLNVERFVIRFWEKEFNLKTDRSHGGQRFYSEDDLATFTEIKELLYKKGFTIAGAKKQMLLGAYTDQAADKATDKTAGRVLGSKKTELLSEAEYQPSHTSANLACTHPEHQFSDNQLADNQSISQAYIQELTNQITADLTAQLTEQLTAQIRQEFQAMTPQHDPAPHQQTPEQAELLTAQIKQELTPQLTQQIKQEMAEQYALDMASTLANQAALFKTEKAELVRQLAELRAHLQKLQALFVK
jgi:DNA-binding transcriptional MerR regulator